MYIRLTTRCNMTCAHCAFSCTVRGSDMPKRTFLAALELARDYGHGVTLGGGEPTLHPRFWEYIGLALGKCEDEAGLFLVTNGKITETALALASLARRGVLGVALSRDEYHDPIESRVVQAFTRPAAKPWAQDYRSGDVHDSREIRSADRLIAAGRAIENQLGGDDRCPCNDIVVNPDGRLWACGCQTVSFGTVWAPAVVSNYGDYDTPCFRHDTEDSLEASAAEAAA